MKNVEKIDQNPNISFKKRTVFTLYFSSFYMFILTDRMIEKYFFQINTKE